MKYFYFMISALIISLLQFNSTEARPIQSVIDVMNYRGDNIAQLLSEIPFYNSHKQIFNDLIGLMFALHIYQKSSHTYNPDTASTIAWTLGAGFRQLLHRLSVPGRSDEYGIIPTVSLAAAVGFVIDKIIYAKVTDKALNHFMPPIYQNKAKLLLGLLLLIDRTVAINKKYPAFVASYI